METWKKVGRILGLVLCGAGCVWFLLPLLRGGFRLGAVFGLAVCALGALLLVFYPRLARKGGWRNARVRLVACFYCLGLCWAGYLTGLMLSAQHRPAHYLGEQ